MQKETEPKHWADQAAENIIREKGEKKLYTCAAGITPSGTIHIGNFREIITVDLVSRALKNLGRNVRFIYSWDDFDAFRKVPADAPKKELLDKYLRYQITEVPDTYDGSHKSYAEHNEKEVEETLPFVNIHPEFIYQAKKYRKCDYAEQIKYVLENKAEIKKILDKYRAEEKSENWWPVSVFCDKCKKDTTRIIDWDENYSLTYECDCGHKETFDFRKKGIAKLPWRIDWPMRWHYEKVDFEPGGKEHSTPGGSRTTGNEIYELLYKEKAPVYLKYDFITIKGTGGKISKSLGNVVSLKDTLEVYEPNIVRWLFAGTRPDAEFAISFDLDVLKLYEDFDRVERIYFDTEKVKDQKEAKKQKRIYELSVTELPKKLPLQAQFRHLTTLLQIYDNDFDKIKEIYREKIKDDYDLKKLKNRCDCVWNWLQKYAPEEFKFKVQNDVNAKLNEKEKEALLLLKDRLEKNKYDDQTLFEEFYNVCKEVNIDNKEFFKAAYKVLVNKERGPKLANFILTLGKEKVISLLKKI